MDTSQLAQALLQAYNQHDPAAVGALYTDDAVHVEMSHGGSKHGPEAIAGGLTYFQRCFPDIRWEVRDLVAADDRAAVTYVLTGSLHADLGPYRAAGQRLELPGVLVVHRDGGRISRAEDYWDSATFAGQMRADAA